MDKIAVLGERDIIIGFKALGLDCFPLEDLNMASQVLADIVKEDYGIIYVTESTAQKISKEIKVFSDQVKPAIIYIPGSNGSLGIGMGAIKDAVERAVGADILD